MPTTAEKRREFRRLHERGCFVMPNPWDAGTTRYLQSLGFAALATTSAGFAFSRGVPDGGVARDAMLAHVAEIAAAADVPVNADFEDGYAATPDGVAESVTRCCATGVAGLSIEDAADDPGLGVYDLDAAVARVAAARRAIDAAGGDVVLTARADGFLRGRPDLADAIRRLQAFSAAGADCLYAPGLTTPEQMRAVVDAVAPKPLNVLVGWGTELTVDALAALGARRISVGGAFARAAWGGLAAAAEPLARSGSFAGLTGARSHADLNRFFAEDTRRR